MIKVTQISLEHCPPCKKWKRELPNVQDVEYKYLDITTDEGQKVKDYLNENYGTYKFVPRFLVEYKGEEYGLDQRSLRTFLIDNSKYYGPAL